MSRRCELDSDDVASLDDTDFRSVPYTEGCVVEAGSRFRLLNPLKDEDTMPAPDEIAHEAPMPEHHDSAPAEPMEHAAGAAEMREHIEVPAGPPTADLSGLKDMAGDNPMVMVALAGIAVLGGSAGWKHWNKLSEQKHEEKMKVLEMQANAQGMNGAQPPPCQAVTLKTEAEIKALQALVAEHSERMAKMEKRTLALSTSDFDPEELESWRVKVDKKLKSITAR